MTAPGPDIRVILNAASGARKGRDFDAALATAFDRHPGRFKLTRVARGHDLAEAIARARDADPAILVAAGGDGTIGAVAEAVAGTGIALGIIPLGTFNFVARGLGLPEDLDAAVDMIATGTPRPVDVGEVNGRLFLNNASLGLYPAILREREGIYRRWGRSRIAAHWSVVRTVLGLVRPLRLRVTVDGSPLRARSPLVFVARSAFQMERYGLGGTEAVRAGRFAVFLAPDVQRLALLGIALRLASGRLRIGRDVELVTGREIVIETDRPRPLVARDGERARLAQPLRFRMREDALRVIAPEPHE